MLDAELAILRGKIACLLRRNPVQSWAMLIPWRKGERVGLDGIEYTCTRSHVGSADNMPGAGRDWAPYWSANIPQRGRTTKKEASK